MNIEHVGLYARDPAALADWYTTVLGLKVVNRIEKPGRPPVVFLQGGHGAVLEILPTEEPPGGRDLTAPGYTHIGIPVSNLDATRLQLGRHGLELTGVRTTSNGWTIGYLSDPEGNALEFIQR